MSYLIEAWIEEGQPCLKIVNAETGKLQMHWKYKIKLEPNVGKTLLSPNEAQTNLQGLFRNLFLMLATDRIGQDMLQLPIPYDFTKRAF